MPTPCFRSLILLSTTLLAAATAHGQTASGALELTRQAAVEMAVRKNIDLKAEALNTAMAKATLARSKGIYDPVVTASTSTGANSFPGDDFRTKDTTAFLGISQNVSTGGSITAAADSGYSKTESQSAGVFSREWRSAAGVTFSQPLLKNFGKENFELDISLADKSYQGSAEQLRFFITDTVLLVVGSYNRLHKLRQVEVAREAALASAVAFLKEIKERPRPGAIQTVEVANAEFAISQRRKDLVDASREVRDEEEKLRFLVGLEEKRQLVPVDPPSREEPAETEEEAVKTAMEIRPDLKQLRLVLAANELQERIDKQQTRPDLSVNVSGGFKGLAEEGWESFEQLGSGEGASWTAGLLLSVPIGNTTAKNDYLLSQLRTEQVKNQLASFAWQIRNAVEADMRALISARLQVQVADQSLQLGQSRLEEYRKNHKAGISTAQEVIDSENDLIFARTSQADAIEAFAFAVVTLWRDMGVLLDHYNIHVDTKNPETISGGGAPVATLQSQTGEASASQSKGPATATPELRGAETPAKGGGEAARDSQEQAEAGPVGGAMESEALGKRGYVLRVGEFTSKEALAAAREKIESAGLMPVVQEGPKRTRPVFRLVAGDFTEIAAARQQLARLRHAKAAGFILINEKKRFCLYAGSFSLEERAVKERRRLAKLGIASHLHSTAVTLPTYLLTAGKFSTRADALEEVDKLRQQGLHSVVMENG